MSATTSPERAARMVAMWNDDTDVTFADVARRFGVSNWTAKKVIDAAMADGKARPVVRWGQKGGAR